MASLSLKTLVAPNVCLVEAKGASQPFSALRQLLKSEGYQVVAFNSAEELFLRQPGSISGCIVIGIEMLGPDGLDLQALLAAKSDLPLTLVTSSTTVREMVRAMKQGATDFFCKPFDERAFLAAVDQAVADHAPKTERHELQESFQLHLANLSPREREVYEMLIGGAPGDVMCKRLRFFGRTHVSAAACASLRNSESGRSFNWCGRQRTGMAKTTWTAAARGIAQRSNFQIRMGYQQCVHAGSTTPEGSLVGAWAGSDHEFA